MGLLDRAKHLLRRLLVRSGLILAGALIVAFAIAINMNAGREILVGLLEPDAPRAIVISVVRLAIPAVGLWLIYRGLR